MADTTAPQLTGLTLPSIIDISGGPVSATFAATATDNQSGVKQVIIWVTKQFTGNIGTLSLIGLFAIFAVATDGAANIGRAAAYL